jgi:olefin beta-lactone synthetase
MVNETLFAYLRDSARRFPTKRAVIETAGHDWFGRAAYAHLTFAALDEESDRIARGLVQIGIGPGVKTVLMVKPSLDLFVLTFALLKIGAVIVLIDPGIGVWNLGACLREVEPHAFIGDSLAHAARLVFGWGRGSLKTLVTRGRRWLWGGHTLAEVRQMPAAALEVPPPSPDDLCAIMFTSGSTGIAKGVEYSQRILCAQVEIMRNVYRYGPEEICLATFPLFALMDVAIGLSVIIPAMDATKPAKADPRMLVETIRDHGATQMFGSPALLDTLSRYGEATGTRIPTIKRVLTAGAPVRPIILERLHKMLPPDAEVHTPYGATEALPLTTISSREILGDAREITEAGGGTCIGRPNPGIELRIMRITDEQVSDWAPTLAVAPGEIGEIVVKGPIVTRRYHGRLRETGLAKITDADGTIMHRMGDLGRLDNAGKVWFCGRKSHRVTTTTGQTLFTVCCEAVFNTHPAIWRTALVGIGEPDRQWPVLCIELEPTACGKDREAIRQDLARLAAAHPHTAVIETFLFHDGFPVDVRHNAKIGREQLAAWAKQTLARAPSPPPPPPPGQGS